jgi:hypothetical protein
MGQAAAMTGGYGNSYAQSVGQQAYQGYLQQLTDKIPELYQIALSKYNSEGDELYKQHALYSDLFNTEYGQHRDAVGDYQTNRNYLANRVDASLAADLDIYGTNRDTTLTEIESANNNINSNRSHFADIAQELANREWGQYTDKESIAQAAINMFNDSIYKNEQSRLAEAELAEKKRQFDLDYAETQRQYDLKRKDDGHVDEDEGDKGGDDPTYSSIYDDCNAYIASGASRSEISSYIRSAYKSGYISEAEFNKLKSTFVPTSYGSGGHYTY